ncbi:MAG: YfhO family protein [Saccharofermentans sp.]|nr:YfhO family protein [Saccharofermentans sp.]
MESFTDEKLKIKTGDGKVIYLLLSFLLPCILVIAALFVLGITPFGSHNLAISDGTLYVRSFSNFSRILHGQENLFYSFKNGLGGNEWSLLAWGGITPVTLLTFFATPENMTEYFTWITVINICICGVTMYLLLADVRGHDLSNLLFSTSYALMGFNVAYCFHFFFFIGPQFLPLIALGLRKIFRGRSPLLYIVSLALSIFFSFYFGFMLCVASVIIFGAYLYTSECDRKSIILKWSISSVIAGLLAAPVWMPAIKAYSGGRIDQDKGGLLFDENMPFIQIFSKLFSGANSCDELEDGLPFIFCGILVVCLVILFFINRKIDIRRRKAAGFVLGFYLLTFYVSVFTKLMHGGTHTNWFNYRYSFVFTFFLILLAAEEFGYIDELDGEDIRKCGLIILASTVVIFSVSYEFISGGLVVLDLALMLTMYVIYKFYKKRSQKKVYLTALLVLPLSMNLFANFAISILNVREWEMDQTQYLANLESASGSVDAIRSFDSGFFRMEKDKTDLGGYSSDPVQYGYNGVTHSGPGDRKFIHQQLNRLGINWHSMRHWYQTGAPAATDALLGLKYITASREDITEEKDYAQISAAGENYIYLNENALEIAVLSNREIESIEMGNNVFENLNDVWKSMTGLDGDIFTIQDDVTFTYQDPEGLMTVTSEEIRNGVQYDASGEAYIEASFVASKTGPIYRCDTSVPDSSNGSSELTMKYIGYYQEGDTVTDTQTVGEGQKPGDALMSFGSKMVYAVADNSLVAGYAKELNARDISVNVEKETCLKGSFTASEGQVILFTIPWDEGWTCYIDGQKADIEKTLDLFMSVNAPEGSHTYELRFFPAWLDYGLYLFGTAFIGCVVLIVVDHKKRKTAVNGSVEKSGTVDNGEQG